MAEAKAKFATEKLYRAAEGGAGWELAVGIGDPLPDDTKGLKTLSELTAMGDAESVVEATKDYEERATRARATGDTYDRRALLEGLPTEAEQKVAETAAAKGVEAPSVERPEVPESHMVTGEGGARIVAGNPQPGTLVSGETTADVTEPESKSKTGRKSK